MINWPWNKKSPDPAITTNTIGGVGGSLDGSGFVTSPFRAELKTDQATAGELDIYSGTWIYVRGYCLTRLDETRRANDNPNASDLATAILRGRIQFIKEILELPKPKSSIPEQELDDED